MIVGALGLQKDACCTFALTSRGMSLTGWLRAIRSHSRIPKAAYSSSLRRLLSADYLLHRARPLFGDTDIERTERFTIDK
jgi:hypothetical protein